MCRKSIQPVIKAFLNGASKKVSNTETDGKSLKLFGNVIAVNKGRIFVSTAGWDTVTTRDRLNGIPGCSVYKRKGILYLNGKEWSGGWCALEIRFSDYYEIFKKNNH